MFCAFVKYGTIGSSDANSKLPPHLFGVIDAAVCASSEQNNLGIKGVEPRTHQVFLFQGQHNSGKTFLTQVALRQLSIYRSRMDSSRLLTAHQLLSLFGTAATSTNEHHSIVTQRWKVSLQKDESSGDSVDALLLRMSSLTKLGQPCMNIFYSLFTMDVLKSKSFRLEGTTAQSFRYSKHSLHNFPEPLPCKQVRALLTQVGCTEGEIKDLFNLLVSILHLGNIMPFVKKQYKNSSALKNTCKLLSLKEMEAVDALSMQEKTSAGRTLKSNRSAKSFQRVRDGIAHLLYHTVHVWIIGKVNAYLGNHGAHSNKSNGAPEKKASAIKRVISRTRKSPSSTELSNEEARKKLQGPLLSIADAPSNHCSILDGVPTNSTSKLGQAIVRDFDSLCQNYADEKLHQYFIKRALVDHQSVYEMEGLDW